MLDAITHSRLRPLLRYLASGLLRIGITADMLTLFGFLVGMLVIPALYFQAWYWALGAIAANRILDGLDGALARLTAPTDAGGFLDITLDFIFYAGVVVGFALADPVANAIPAVVLIFSFMGTGSSFLAFAILAEKNRIKSLVYPHKSIHYLGGLTEGTETIAFFVICCLFPQYFVILAWIFAGLCGITTLTRIFFGYKTLRMISSDINC